MTHNINHTPGPWVIEDNFSIAEKMQVASFSKDGNRVLQVIVRSFNAAEDMKLIAAAPELLEALKQCRLALEPYDDVKPRDWKTDREKLAFAHQAARAAIAKATGDQP